MKEHRGEARFARAIPIALSWIAVQSAIGGASIGQLIANPLPLGSVFFLLTLVFLVNPLLVRLSPRLRLTTTELTVVWAMVCAASAVPGYGLMEFLFPYLAAPLYFVTAENQWAEVLFPNLREWLYVNDPRAVRGFFEGIDAGTPLPWAAWTRPAAFAIAFWLALFLGVGCWAVLLRRQWIDRERYAFPLVQVAQRLTHSAPAGRALNDTFRDRLFWVAFGAMLLVHTLRGVHRLYPAVPDFPVEFSIARFFPHRPWNMLATAWPLWPHLYFSVVGVTYFLHLDVAMSLWFFFALYKLQQVFFSAFSITAVNTQHQVMGAVVMLALASLWQARRHLASVLRTVGPGSTGGTADGAEPMSYRVAVAGIVVSLMAMTFLCVLSGMSLWFTGPFLLLLWTLATVTAWYVSNAGLLLVNVGFSPYQFFTTLFGTRFVGPRNLVLMGFSRSSIPHWTAESLMPYVMQNFRLADMHGLPARRLRLPLWMGVSVLVAIAVAFVSSMHWIYGRGALNLEPWVYAGVGRNGIAAAVRRILNPAPPNVPGILSAGLGAGVMGFLVVMRQRFLWWPLHPLGYALGVTWAPFHLWFSTLVGWALKALILAVGGFGMYRRWRPLFTGFVLGEYFMTAVWSLIGLKTRIAYWGLPH